jgi:hypothetical protein
MYAVIAYQHILFNNQFVQSLKRGQLFLRDKTEFVRTPSNVICMRHHCDQLNLDYLDYFCNVDLVSKKDTLNNINIY